MRRAFEDDAVIMGFTVEDWLASRWCAAKDTEAARQVNERRIDAALEGTGAPRGRTWVTCSSAASARPVSVPTHAVGVIAFCALMQLAWNCLGKFTELSLATCFLSPMFDSSGKL